MYIPNYYFIHSPVQSGYSIQVPNVPSPKHIYLSYHTAFLLLSYMYSTTLDAWEPAWEAHACSLFG